MLERRVVRKVPVAMLGFLLCLGAVLVSGLFSARAEEPKAGTIGDCSWEFKDEGNGETTFRLYPTNGVEGTVDWDKGKGTAPWNAYIGGDHTYGTHYATATRVIIDKPVRLKCGRGMFWGFTNVRAMDLSGLITDEVSDSIDMFRSCGSLTHLNLSGLKTNKVTDMTRMFFDCLSLKEVDVTGWDMSKVEWLHSTFENCSKLEKVKGMETWTWNGSPKLGSMEAMFCRCHALKEVDMSRLRTDNVTTMKWAFYECKALPSLDVENWNVEKLENLHEAFAWCTNIKEFKGINSWNAKSLKDIVKAFFRCESVRELDLNKWNVSQCTSLSNVFAYCYKLERVEVNEWDTSKVTDLSLVFSDMHSLRKLDLSKWDTSHVKNFIYALLFCAYTPGKYPKSLDGFISLGKLRELDISGPGWTTKSLEGTNIEHFIASSELSVLKISNDVSLNKKDSEFSQLGLTGSKSGTHWQRVDVTKGGTVEDPKGEIFDSANDSAALRNFHSAKAGTPGFETYVRVSPSQYFMFDKNSPDATGEMESQVIAPGAKGNINASTFSYPGHRMVKWNTEKDGSGKDYAVGEEYTNTGSNNKRPIVLYAQWEKTDQGGQGGGQGQGGQGGGQGQGGQGGGQGQGGQGNRKGQGSQGNRKGQSGYNNWQRQGGNVFYYQNGAKLTGWHELSGTIQDPSSPKKHWFYFNSEGIMLKGQHELVGGFDQRKNWFYFDEETGAEIRGWKYIDYQNKWCYYRDGDGIMLKGQHELVGGFDQCKNWFYFDEETGAEIRGWKYIDYQDKWCYYRDGDGIMLKGQHELQGGDNGDMNWFYFDEITGAEFRNCWKEIPSQDKTCYYGSDGAMYKGWCTVDDDDYYFDEETGAVM